MQEPLVSVHMITYNHEAFIRRAIEGVLSQQCDFTFELVIGEDCSTDGTRDIVTEYQKKYPDIIRLVTSETNVGMKKNGVRTFMACRGKYVAYCEGDDYWQRKDKLQIQAEYLEAHAECGLVFSDHDRYFEQTGQRIKQFYETTGNLPPKPLNVYQGWGDVYNILTCTVMGRREIMHSIISQSSLYMDERNSGGTDIPLFIEVSERCATHYINESLSTYTVQAESASNTRNMSKRARFIKSNIESYLYLAEKYNRTEEQVYFRNKLHTMCFWVSFWDRDPEPAKQVMQRHEKITCKEWLLYFGAMNRVVHFMIVILVKLVQFR